MLTVLTRGLENCWSNAQTFASLRSQPHLGWMSVVPWWLSRNLCSFVRGDSWGKIFIKLLEVHPWTSIMLFSMFMTISLGMLVHLILAESLYRWKSEGSTNLIDEHDAPLSWAMGPRGGKHARASCWKKQREVWNVKWKKQSETNLDMEETWHFGSRNFKLRVKS